MWGSTLKAYISLYYEVAPNGDKPIENSFVAFCFVLFYFVCWDFLLFLLLPSDQESELQIATILSI